MYFMLAILNHVMFPALVDLASVRGSPIMNGTVVGGCEVHCI